MNLVVKPGSKVDSFHTHSSLQVTKTESSIKNYFIHTFGQKRQVNHDRLMNVSMKLYTGSITELCQCCNTFLLRHMCRHTWLFA